MGFNLLCCSFSAAVYTLAHPLHSAKGFPRLFFPLLSFHSFDEPMCWVLQFKLGRSDQVIRLILPSALPPCTFKTRLPCSCPCVCKNIVKLNRKVRRLVLVLSTVQYRQSGFGDVGARSSLWRSFSPSPPTRSTPPLSFIHPSCLFFSLLLLGFTARKSKSQNYTSLDMILTQVCWVWGPQLLFDLHFFLFWKAKWNQALSLASASQHPAEPHVVLAE